MIGGKVQSAKVPACQGRLAHGSLRMPAVLRWYLRRRMSGPTEPPADWLCWGLEGWYMVSHARGSVDRQPRQCTLHGLRNLAPGAAGTPPTTVRCSPHRRTCAQGPRTCTGGAAPRAGAVFTPATRDARQADARRAWGHAVPLHGAPLSGCRCPSWTSPCPHTSGS